MEYDASRDGRPILTGLVQVMAAEESKTWPGARMRRNDQEEERGADSCQENRKFIWRIATEPRIHLVDATQWENCGMHCPTRS